MNAEFNQLNLILTVEQIASALDLEPAFENLSRKVGVHENDHYGLAVGQRSRDTVGLDDNEVGFKSNTVYFGIDLTPTAVFHISVQ